MQKSEIITDLKNLIGPAVEVDDAGLTVWVNDAYGQMVDEIIKINPDYFTKSSTTSTITDQQEYALPSDFEKMLMVNLQIDGTWRRVRPMPNINFVPIIQRTDSNQGFDQGDPQFYLVKDKIGFMPIPDETTSNNVKIWYVYSPSELSDDSDTPDFPTKYHHMIKYGAYANYLDQDDEHVAAERMRINFASRMQNMIENIQDMQVDEPKSVELWQNTDMYKTNTYVV